MSSRVIRSSSSTCAGRFRDHGAARRGEFLLHLGQLVLDDRLDARARAQDVEIVGDFGGKLVELFLDLVAAERGQPLQAQIEDGLGLFGGKLASCPSELTLWRGSSISVTIEATSLAGQSRSIKASRASFGILGGADQLDDLVDIGDRDGEADQHMGAVARLAEQNLVRRDTTSSRKAMKALSRSFSVITSGRPPSSATMLAPNDDCSGVKR